MIKYMKNALQLELFDQYTKELVQGLEILTELAATIKKVENLRDDARTIAKEVRRYIIYFILKHVDNNNRSR